MIIISMKQNIFYVKELTEKYNYHYSMKKKKKPNSKAREHILIKNEKKIQGNSQRIV